MPGHNDAPENVFPFSGRAETRRGPARSSGRPCASPEPASEGPEKTRGRGGSASSSFSREGYAPSSRGKGCCAPVPSRATSGTSRLRWNMALGMEALAASSAGLDRGRLDSFRERHKGRLTLGRECGHGREPSKSPARAHPTAPSPMANTCFRILTAFRIRFRTLHHHFHKSEPSLQAQCQSLPRNALRSFTARRGGILTEEPVQKSDSFATKAYQI